MQLQIQFRNTIHTHVYDLNKGQVGMLTI